MGTKKSNPFHWSAGCPIAQLLVVVVVPVKHFAHQRAVFAQTFGTVPEQHVAVVVEVQWHLFSALVHLYHWLQRLKRLEEPPRQTATRRQQHMPSVGHCHWSLNGYCEANFHHFFCPFYFSYHYQSLVWNALQFLKKQKCNFKIYIDCVHLIVRKNLSKYYQILSIAYQI